LNQKAGSIHIRCPAKVNLFLRILGQREDGYHEVLNVMQTVTLFDELKVSKQERGVTLVCSDRELDRTPEENLAFRAADLFLRNGYGRGGIRLELRKNTPIAAGLGGGSSDGACCLLALNELFGSNLPAEELRSLSAKLGSDPPFFIAGGTALCTGRGDTVHQLTAAPGFAAIVATPKERLLAAEVYDFLGTEDFKGPEPGPMLEAIEHGDLKGICSALYNGLEKAVLRKMPCLEKVKRFFADAGSLGTVVCGSGPTILAIFSGVEEAEEGLRGANSSGLAGLSGMSFVRTF
jgi:4-diphosphocytidyl-2-C-methyl-D-erythritol kinase